LGIDSYSSTSAASKIDLEPKSAIQNLMTVKIQAAFGIEYNGFSVAQRNEGDLLLDEILNRLFDEWRF
jgi:hypothetical protein